MNGIIYCRVSSKEQAEGTSLESQELACREYAKTKSISILKTFIEEGESAKFADRTKLLQLIDFCRENKGQVQVLLVWKVDRFARNVADHFNVKATLVKYGVRIVSVTEPIDSNPEGNLMETILAGFAQFDNDIRATRTVQGMRRKLQEGIYPWKQPLGYTSLTKNGEKKTLPDQPDQPLFGLLQKAWEEFATGAHTKAEIGRLMQQLGITTRKGKPISAQSLDNLLRNPYYAGILVDPWSREEYQGQHVPMVSRETFARVQQVIGRRNRSTPHKKERPEFPLRGVVRCDQCLHYLTSSFSRGRTQKYPYYHCHNKGCSGRGRSHPAQPIHKEFETFLSNISPRPELMEKLGQLLVQQAEQRRASLKARKVRQEAALARVTRENQELIRMRMQGLITDEEFQVQKRALFDRRAAFEATPIDHSLAPEEVQSRLSEIIEPLSQLPATWKALPPAERRRFEHLVLPAGFAIQKIRTAELGLLFRLISGFSGNDSTMGSLTGESSNQIWLEIAEFSDLLRAYRNPKDPSRVAVRTSSSEGT